MKYIIIALPLILAGCGPRPELNPAAVKKVDAAVNKAVASANNALDKLCANLPLVKIGFDLTVNLGHVPEKYSQAGAQAFGLVQGICDNRPTDVVSAYKAALDSFKTGQTIWEQFKRN